MNEKSQLLWNDAGEWIGGFTQYPDYENRESKDIEDAIAIMHERERKRLLGVGGKKI